MTTIPSAFDDRPGALDGIRVIDLTSVLMAPLATRMLADHGADVIRLEPVTTEAFLSTPPTRHEGMNWFALNAHRNKRSISLDLKSADGATAAGDLMASADVFVTNMRARAIERLGLDAATWRAHHPSLIHCVANGYGSGGPYAGQAAYDDAIQAASGYADLVGRVRGEPQFSPAVIADKVVGLHILQAVMAALFHRERTGQGQAIEVPMFETMVAFNLVEHHAGGAYEPPMGDVGYARGMSPFRKPYRCADGWMCLLPYTDANWRHFFSFVGHAEMIEDPRFAHHVDRIENSSELYAFVEKMAPEHTVAEWLTYCSENSIPAAEVMDLANAPDDPHLQAVDLLPVMEHPTEGQYRAVRDSIAYEATSTRLRRHAPNPGEHTRELLTELGWDGSRIDQLIEQGFGKG
ncbi:MAG: CoA transferase [Actinomycetia bacterium]|nr:CoA transferase [Actinomycetes bacterium]